MTCQSKAPPSVGGAKVYWRSWQNTESFEDTALECLRILLYSSLLVHDVGTERDRRHERERDRTVIARGRSSRIGTPPRDVVLERAARLCRRARVLPHCDVVVNLEISLIRAVSVGGDGGGGGRSGGDGGSGDGGSIVGSGSGSGGGGGSGDRSRDESGDGRRWLAA